MSKRIYIDVETTGLKSSIHRVTQLSAIVEINGVRKKTVDYKKNIYKQLLKLLDSYIDKYNPKDKFYFIGYNVNFDIGFVRALFLKNGNKFYGSYFHPVGIDVMALAANKIMYRRTKPVNMKLVSVLKYFGIKCTLSKFHDAKYDITKTRLLYKKVR
jgi:DNA polymerase-3 subunit epsilon